MEYLPAFGAFDVDHLGEFHVQRCGRDQPLVSAGRTLDRAGMNDMELFIVLLCEFLVPEFKQVDYFGGHFFPAGFHPWSTA